MRIELPSNISIISRYSIKVQELTEYFSPLRHNSPALGISMSNTYLDKAFTVSVISFDLYCL